MAPRVPRWTQGPLRTEAVLISGSICGIARAKPPLKWTGRAPPPPSNTPVPAARLLGILGATRLRLLRQDTAPLLTSSVVSTWCFIFTGAIRNLSPTILLTTANTKLVSVIIHDLNESGELGRLDRAPVEEEGLTAASS